MKQMSLAAATDHTGGFEKYRKPTRRDAFLAEMQSLVPWSDLVTLIEPHYPKAGNGRPPIGLERMLRIHCSSTGSTWLMWPARRPCTTRRHCVRSSGSILAAAIFKPVSK